MTEDMMAMIRRKDFAPFNLALSGGETAKHMFSLWVDEYKDKIDWNIAFSNGDRNTYAPLVAVNRSLHLGEAHRASPLTVQRLRLCALTPRA